jgi:hypothetical protein
VVDNGQAISAERFLLGVVDDCPQATEAAGG